MNKKIDRAIVTISLILIALFCFVTLAIDKTNQKENSRQVEIK